MSPTTNQPLKHPSTRSLPRWSPDGSKLLVELGRRPSVVSRDLKESNEVGPEDTWVTYSDWSPDGERLSYSYRGLHDDLTEPHWGIYSSRPDGGDIQLMTATGWRGQWSPDGQKMAYHLVKKDAPTRLSVMDRDGKNETVLAQEPNLGGTAWSPDSKTIVYENWDGEDGRLFRFDLETGKKSQLLDRSGGSDKSAQFSPDGSKILFERFTNPGRKTEIRILDVATGIDQTFAALNRSNHDASWSPDGKSVVFTSNTSEDDFNLYLADAGGGNVRQLTSLPGDEFSPAWSPDGKSIAFYHQARGSDKGLQIVDLGQTATSFQENFTFR